MATSKREQIHGTTPLDIKKINDNTEALWYKVNNDINFENTDSNVQTHILKQWLPFQGEGNLDATHPLILRFYIPPNVSTISKATFSAIVSPYRMDSDVAKADTIPIEAQVTTSVEETVVTAVASANYVGDRTSPVRAWGTTKDTGGIPAPTVPIINAHTKLIDATQYGGAYAPYQKGTSENCLGSDVVECVTLSPLTGYEVPVSVVDMLSFQHTHLIPGHGHTINASCNPHGHKVAVKASIPPHGHKLNEGIKESIVTPQNVTIKVNNVAIGNTMSAGNATQNDVAFTDLVNIGSWNIIEIRTSTLARATLYGVVELITQYGQITGN